MQRAATSCWLALAQLKPSLTLQPLSCAAVRPISTSLAQAMPSEQCCQLLMTLLVAFCLMGLQLETCT